MTIGLHDTTQCLITKWGCGLTRPAFSQSQKQHWNRESDYHWASLHLMKFHNRNIRWKMNLWNQWQFLSTQETSILSDKSVIFQCNLDLLRFFRWHFYSVLLNYYFPANLNLYFLRLRLHKVLYLLFFSIRKTKTSTHRELWTMSLWTLIWRWI